MSIHSIMQSAKSDWLLLPFQFGFFYFFFLYDFCGEDFQSYVESKWQEWSSYLVSNLIRNAFSFLLLSMMSAISLPHMGLISLQYVPSVPAWLRVFFFNYEWMLILSKAFSASIQIIIWYLFFNLLIDWILDINESLHLWDKFHLILIYIDEFNL